MNLIITFCIFVFSIFIHEIGHILIGWYFSKEVPSIRFRKLSLLVIPKSIYTYRQKQTFLGAPIIIGLLSFLPIFFYFPLESWIAMVSYLVSCGADFHNLIRLEVENK